MMRLACSTGLGHSGNTTTPRGGKSRDGIAHAIGADDGREGAARGNAFHRGMQPVAQLAVVLHGARAVRIRARLLVVAVEWRIAETLIEWRRNCGRSMKISSSMNCTRPAICWHVHWRWQVSPARDRSRSRRHGSPHARPGTGSPHPRRCRFPAPRSPCARRHGGRQHHGIEPGAKSIRRTVRTTTLPAEKPVLGDARSPIGSLRRPVPRAE